MIGEVVRPERGLIPERHFVDLSPKIPYNPPDLRIWPKIAAGNTGIERALKSSPRSYGK